MRNLDSCRCWRCTLCPCKVRNEFLANFWNCTVLLCILCIYNTSNFDSSRYSFSKKAVIAFHLSPDLLSCCLPSKHVLVSNSGPWPVAQPNRTVYQAAYNIYTQHYTATSHVLPTFFTYIIIITPLSFLHGLPSTPFFFSFLTTAERRPSETSNIRTHIFFTLRSNNEKSAITSRNKVLCHFF